MRFRLLAIILLTIITSCTSRTHVPNGILSTTKMQAVLWDLMRSDQYLTDFVLNKDSSLDKKLESTKMYQQVLAIHDLDRESFKKSFDYYQSHPALLQVVLDSISAIKPVTVTTITTPTLAADTLQPKIKPVVDTPRVKQVPRPMNGN